jgi:hypothetical protein
VGTISMVTAPQLRSIDVLGALSLAGDMAMGLRAGHGVRATYIGMRIAGRLGLSAAQRVVLWSLLTRLATGARRA